MIYLVYGEQYPLVKKRAQRIIKSVLNDEIDDFSYVRMNGKEDLVQDIVYECNLIPLGGKKVVRIDEPYFLTSIKEKVSIDKEQDFKTLSDYILNDNSEEVCLLFVCETGSLNKKSEVYKAIEKNGQIIFEEGLSIDSLRLTGVKYFEKKGSHISSEALELLLERVGDDVSKFILEADKLSLYSKDITPDDVFKMVPLPLEQNAFNICENLINNKISHAIKIYRDLITLKEEPVRLLYLFASQFRFYCQVAYLYKIEKKSQENIATTLKVHPYRVKLACRILVNISYDKLIYVMDYLFDLDAKIKNMEIDPYIGLELFLVNFNEI